MKLEKIIAVRTAKTVYVDGDTAIKVFDESYPKANVLNEALNHARVEETELNVPKILSVSETDGKWAIAMENVKGKLLSEYMAEDFDKYLDMFVELQIAVHGEKCALLPSHKEKMTRKIAEADLSATEKYDLHTHLEAMPKHKKLLHGDFNPSNIIVTEDGKAFIIDWAHATQGNASADVARTYLLFWLDGNIDGAEKYLEKFCEKTDTAKQYVQKWLPIVAASQMVKGKPEQKEFLKSWIGVVDYQ
ncbi:MAG: phosphotransferase [Bacillota bacterium]